MSYDYKADRWRDRSIISQTAAKVAADLTMHLLTQYPPEDGEAARAVGSELFGALHATVVSTIMEAVGEDDISTTVSSGNESPHNESGTSSSTSGEPYGSTVLKFGKFKGMTISEINNAQDDQGKSGRSYLEWLNSKTDDQFMRKATGAFLEATRG